VIKIGVKVLSNKAGLSGGNKEWGQDFLKMGRDGMTVEFVYLDDLRPDTPADHKIVQYQEYVYLPGETNGKQWSMNVPVGEDDPPEMSGLKQRYQYASHVLITKIFDTSSKAELEPNGDPAATPWKDRPVKDRVRIIAQGRDTSNTFLGKLDDWEEDNEGAPGHLMRLDRGNNGQRTAYSLRFVKNAKMSDEILKETEEVRFNIIELLEDKNKFGLIHAGYVKAASQPDFDQMVPKTNGDNLEMEGDGEKDIFDDVKPEDIDPQAADFVS